MSVKLKIRKICEYCKIEFFVNPYREKTARFCSKSCKTKFEKPTCPDSKRNISGLKGREAGFHHSLEVRKKIGKNTGKYKGKYMGERHWNWKGGITEENRIIKQRLEYIIWRNEVYRKDNWSCRICGKHCQRGNIVAHHLKLFSEFPELRFSIDNGITLCRSCHLKLHHAKHFKADD